MLLNSVTATADTNRALEANGGCLENCDPANGSAGSHSLIARYTIPIYSDRSRDKG